MQTYRRNGLSFDVDHSGDEAGKLVILLHGFPADRSCWSEVSARLVDAGYQVLAPDLRGYSPGARPAGRRAYAASEIVLDVVALADAAGHQRFDLVGHDWGAAIAWAAAGRYPHRVRTLTALSVPHPRAFVEAMASSTQVLRSWYMLFFQLPYLPEKLMGWRSGSGLEMALRRTGLEAARARRYARRAVSAAEATAAVNWYRALPWSARQATPAVDVPALYVYGDGDSAISRAAADRCGAWVTGPYRYEVLAGAGHWLPEAHPEIVAELIVSHLAHPGGSPSA